MLIHSNNEVHAPTSNKMKSSGYSQLTGQQQNNDFKKFLQQKIEEART